jgi:hypothetical protein
MQQRDSKTQPEIFLTREAAHSPKYIIEFGSQEAGII